jgi:inner membrane transporter RhtA
VTLEFIGPLLVAVFWLKTFVDYLWVLLAAEIVLIAPWTNNGINVLGVLFALLAGAFGLLYRPGRKGIKIMKDGEACCNWNALASLLIVPFGIMGNGFSNLTPTFLSGGTCPLSSAIPFTLEMKALGQLPARTFSILMSLEPAAASICALIFLQNTFFNEIVAVVFLW